MGLNIIDFSNGIRPEEIQENFDYLQAQLSRERISVGGAGIASGLDITFDISNDKFEIIVTDGNIIDNEGNEVFIPGMIVPVEPPILYEEKEFCTLNEEKTLTLKRVPYAMNRRRPSQYLSSLEPELSGINIRYRDSISNDDYIRVRDIINTTVTVTGALKRELEVTYKYTENRIDTLYINDEMEIVIQKGEGTTSSTPSVSKLPEDAKYLIAYIEINSEYVDDNDNVPHAWMYIKDDLRSIRNLYTDSDGTLYICNTSFDDLQIIHMKEPENPKPNTLWLNLADNTLYCWRNIDEFVYKNIITVSTDFLENISEADLTFSTYMSFMIGENELSVYLNGSKLLIGRDYEEVGIDLPTYGGNEGEPGQKGNVFRILNTLERADGYKDVLIPGDVLTYMIRYKDSQYLWVPINKMNYINVKNTKVYSTYYDGISPEYIYEKNEHGNEKAYFDSTLANSLGYNPVTDYHYKYQYFLFHRIEDMNMHFTPGKNELSVMINQMYLHQDQFKEITVYDIIEKKLPREVLTAAATKFGWTDDYVNNNFNGVFDNSGIGFMLLEPLDSGAKADSTGNHYSNYYGSNDLFVEAIVERRICATPINNKMERSATFVLEDTIVADAELLSNRIVELKDIKYRYNEHQLEVFINGLKQIEGIDYIEEFGYLKDEIEIQPIDPDEIKEDHDQDYYTRKKAAICNKFKFLDGVAFSEGALITYKVTTNIYSYDHINNILDGLGDILTDCKATIDNYTSMMDKMEEDLERRMKSVEEQVQEFINLTGEYLTTKSIIDIGQLPELIVDNAIKSLNHINTSIELDSDEVEYKINDIYPEDYITVFHHKYIGSIESFVDLYWIRGVHYDIKEDASNPGNFIFKLLTNDYNRDAATESLYISGLKISNRRNF